jgi:hypothetical protein
MRFLLRLFLNRKKQNDKADYVALMESAFKNNRK